MMAAPSDSPITVVPKSATAPIVSGIAMTSSRVTEPQARGSSARSSFSPVPKSATMTANSARCSISVASSNGSIHRTPSRSIIVAATRPNPR